MGNEKVNSIDIKFHNIKIFTKYLYDEKLTLPHIIKKVLFSMEDCDEFLLGIQFKDKLYVITPEDTEFIERSLISKEKESIKETFKNLCKNAEQNFVEYFRCTLGWKLDEEDFTLYYFAHIYNRAKVDYYYISEMEKEYYKNFCDALLYILSVPGCISDEDKDKGFKFSFHDITKKLPQKAYINFTNTIEKHFGIDINLIVELSGNYYEGEACRSSLAFQLINKEFNKKVVLGDPIPLKSENIRLIRKMLQTAGQKDQFLLLKKRNKIWEIVALCMPNDQKLTGCVEFYILGHMAWQMKIENRDCLCYRSGKLEIMEDGYYDTLFKRKYKEVFNLNHTPEKALCDLFEKARNQRHGTVLVIEEKKVAGVEADRLKKESSGINFYKKDIDKMTNDANDDDKCNLFILDNDFIDGITSIDGAILVNENGKCYGMGYILDGGSSLVGRPDRGARYNSTARYIWSLKNKGRGMAIIVSEDKTIDIISTKDDLEKEHKKLNGKEYKK